MKKKRIKLNFGEQFHPDAKCETPIRLIPAFGEKIDTSVLAFEMAKVDITKMPDCPINAIMGDIEEMDGNKITKFRLKAVSIIPKWLK